MKPKKYKEKSEKKKKSRILRLLCVSYIDVRNFI